MFLPQFELSQQLRFHNSVKRGSYNYYEHLELIIEDADNRFLFTSALAQNDHHNLHTTILLLISHQPTSFYKIKVIQQFYYKYFPVTIWRVSLIAGPNTYRGGVFQQFQNIKPDDQFQATLFSSLNAITECSFFQIGEFYDFDFFDKIQKSQNVIKLSV
ncbi:hypothetical protein ABPG73_015566 [Tetrahymena malaccensis]